MENMEINDKKPPLQIDFISEFYYKNCQHIIDNILGELCPMTILRASTVCQTWKIILKQSSKFPHDIAQLFNRYHAKNPFPIEDLHGGQHLSSFEVQSHSMFPGGDVKTILVEKDAMFVGLASGLTKQWDLSNYDNLKYPATRYFDPDNGKGVTHLETNDKYLVTGHGNIVLIWSLDTAAILSEAVGLDSQFDFIGSLALCHEKKLTMITRFNGFLRVYDDIFLSRFEEYKLDAVPKKASLSSETFVYSYHIEEEEETDFVPNVTHILSIIKVRSHGIEKHKFDSKKEIHLIIQDYPILFLEMSNDLKQKEYQLWDLHTLNQLYSICLNDFHLRYLGMKNWIFWCHVGRGKGQLTYGTVIDLLDKNFYKKISLEDKNSQDEELYLSYLSGNTLVFSKPGGIEMKVFGLKYVEKEDLC